MTRSSGKKENNGLLGRAVEEWRRNAPTPSLSSDARDRVLRRAIDETAAVRTFPALFVATRRLIFAGILPLLVLGVFAVLVSMPGDSPEAGPNVIASRMGDRVVFTIANGGGGHTVYRSTEAHRFEPGGAVRVTDGEFEVPADEDARVVFYRID
jgi:hypothetical protein